MPKGSALTLCLCIVAVIAAAEGRTVPGEEVNAAELDETLGTAVGRLP